MSLALVDVEFPAHVRLDRPLTDDEFLRFCAANEPYRIERDANGELVIMSLTGTEGGNAELDIATDLNIWARQDGRGRVLGPNSGVKLPDTSIRAADAAWVSWDRYDAAHAGSFKGVVPQFVIEVRSDSDRLPALRKKMQQWLANGCELAWLIDPVRKTVEIHRPNREVEVQEGHSAVCGEGPVDGFVLELGRMWS